MHSNPDEPVKKAHKPGADLALVRRVASGDESAFDTLYINYHARLSRFLMNVCGRYNLVEEVINDTMMVVWDKSSEFRGDSAVSSWIMSIAYRRALKLLGKYTTAKRKEAELGESVLTEDKLPVQNPEQERAQWLKLGLEQLPLEQRLSLELAYYMGYSCAEIAVMTDCPVNTVKSRLFKARKKLQSILPLLAGGQTSEDIEVDKL